MSTVKDYNEVPIDDLSGEDKSIAMLTLRASLWCQYEMPKLGRFFTTGGFSTPDTVASFEIEYEAEESGDLKWISEPVIEKLGDRVIRGFWFSLNPGTISITVGVEATGYIWSRDLLFGMEYPGEMLSVEQLEQLRGFARELWGPAWDISCPDGNSELHTHNVMLARRED